MTVNKVILVGRLGADPEYRQSASGTAFTRCNVATNRIWKNDRGEKVTKTEWHRVVFFKRLAEIASQYLKKGSQVYIEGELQTSSWEKDGVKRYSTDVIAQEMRMLDSRRDMDSSDNAPYQGQSERMDGSYSGQGDQTAGGASTQKPQKAQDSGDNLAGPDEDIPF